MNTKRVEVIKDDINSKNAHSKIIKISLLMPNIGNGLKDISEISIHQYAWVKNSNTKLNNNITTINDSKIFSPWKLVFREN